MKHIKEKAVNGNRIFYQKKNNVLKTFYIFYFVYNSYNPPKHPQN